MLQKLQAMHPAFRCFEELSVLHHDMLKIWNILQFQVPSENDDLVQKFNIIFSRLDRIIVEKVPMVQQIYIDKELEIIRIDEILKHEKRMKLSLSGIPEKLEVSGRRGFNIAMNGIYKKGPKKHNNMPYYSNEKTGWVIRFWRKRWMFDWRGLNNDDTAGAVAGIEDARHPGLVDKAWKVFNGTAWVQDCNITVRAVSENNNQAYEKGYLGDVIEEPTIQRKTSRASSQMYGISSSQVARKKARASSYMFGMRSQNERRNRAYSSDGKHMKRKSTSIRKSSIRSDRATRRDRGTFYGMSTSRSVESREETNKSIPLKRDPTIASEENRLLTEYSEDCSCASASNCDGERSSQSMGGGDFLENHHDEYRITRSRSGSMVIASDSESELDRHQSDILKEDMIKEITRVSTENIVQSSDRIAQYNDEEKAEIQRAKVVIKKAMEYSKKSLKKLDKTQVYKFLKSKGVREDLIDHAYNEVQLTWHI